MSMPFKYASTVMNSSVMWGTSGIWFIAANPKAGIFIYFNRETKISPKSLIYRQFDMNPSSVAIWQHHIFKSNFCFGSGPIISHWTIYMLPYGNINSLSLSLKKVGCCHMETGGRFVLNCLHIFKQLIEIIGWTDGNVCVERYLTSEDGISACRTYKRGQCYISVITNKSSK